MIENNNIAVKIIGLNFVSKLISVSEDKTYALYDVLEKTVKELAFLGEEEENIKNVIKNIYIERNS